MDIRCGSCNKLFRVADDKISGRGIRFKCSRCGEIITVTRDDATAPAPGPAITPQAAPEAPTVKVPPAAPPASHPQPSFAPPSGEFLPYEYQAPVPSANMSDFDLSMPDAAAGAAGGQEEEPSGGEGFSFGTPSGTTGSESSSSEGEISISEEEQREAETAFQFGADSISETAQKPVLSSETARPTQETGALPEKQLVPELNLEEQKMTSEQSAEDRELREEAEPPLRSSAEFSAAPGEEADKESGLEQAIAIPGDVGPEPPSSQTFPGEAREVVRPDEPDLTKAQAVTAGKSVHPLASGNLTGAVAGLGCALPVVSLALFAFGVMMQFMPGFSVFPRYHLLAVIGGGLVGLGVMTGIVIAIVQAQAGKKLFFLLNILIGATFGLVYGAGMDTITSVASGGGLHLQSVLASAVAGGMMALLMSIVIVIVRRIVLVTKDESFAAAISVPQKVGVALSLIVIVLSLYAEGSLIGSMERAAGEMQQQQFEADITPDGMTIANPQGYVDQTTGDLVITGAVQNTLDKPKDGWYLKVDVFDKDQKVLATIKMLNGVQLFDQRDFDLLAARGKNIDELKAGMVTALQSATIRAKGNVRFEMHLMNPPQEATSFYPALMKFSFHEATSEKTVLP